MEEKILDVNGRIPTYRVQDEYDLLKNLPSSKPSKRIVNTKKGLKAIKALIDIEQNHNVSWYKYLKERNIDNFSDVALFYRGNKITFGEMFKKADLVAKSLANMGLVSGDEIGLCVSNTPELVYILLAANKLGIKVNCFGAAFNKDYLSSIVDGVSCKVIFASDDIYEEVQNIFATKNIDKIVLISLADSLPKQPNLCDEYEPELDDYYHYENKVPTYRRKNKNIVSFEDFIMSGNDYNQNIQDVGNLESDFLITYTSGSTKVGLPKAIIHKNRSLITMGRFHDPELCGNPKIIGLRGLAHIHPDSNTNIITCISDNLMQGWSVALEPEYDKEKALDYIILNKPNYLDITTSFMLEVAKQYLIDKRYHQDGIGRKLPFLLATFTVGEGTQKGEEKFINKFLRESRAGSGISIMGLKLPFTTLSIGGGDCEHGGIYYTLWKSLYQKLYKPLLGKNDLGMFPVPYAVVTALKQNEDGSYVECDYNEPGIIVANSYSNLSGYKNNLEATQKLIIKDNLGRNWVTCNVYGFIDSVGSVHVKGRVATKRQNFCPNYHIDDLVTMDTKNILSCATVHVDDNIVINVQFQHSTKMSDLKIIEAIYERLAKELNYETIDAIYIRKIPFRDSFPLTAAGKRNLLGLELLGLEGCYKITDYVKKDINVKKLRLKK